jgi:hypothetical protein
MSTRYIVACLIIVFIVWCGIKINNFKNLNKPLKSFSALLGLQNTKVQDNTLSNLGVAIPTATRIASMADSNPPSTIPITSSPVDIYTGSTSSTLSLTDSTISSLQSSTSVPRSVPPTNVPMTVPPRTIPMTVPPTSIQQPLVTSIPMETISPGITTNPTFGTAESKSSA